MTGILLRRGEDTGTYRDTKKVGYIKMKVCCHQPTNAKSHQKLKEIMKDFLVEALAGTCFYRRLDYRLLDSNLSENKFVILSHLVSGTVLWQPQETHVKSRSREVIIDLEWTLNH